MSSHVEAVRCLVVVRVKLLIVANMLHNNPTHRIANLAVGSAEQLEDAQVAGAAHNLAQKREGCIN